MKINLIHLQNIKSYDDREIRFFDGVNFISGINGAGKSTIIESIGFALFDVKPKPLVNFLRDGAKSGAVTVFFTANDDREYRVVRKLRGNAAFSWQVYDAETGGELDLHGAGDVRAWLAENNGIDPDQDPEKLFRDVIGVNQGNFTAPFLQSEVPRKQVFNSILKVDGYREAYQKSANAVTILRDAIREKEKERDILLTRVENYDTVKAEAVELAGFIRAGETVLAALNGEIKAKETERDRLQKIRADRDRTEAAVREAELNIKNLSDKQVALEKDLFRAQEAARRVSAAAPGYEEFLRLKGIAAGLEKQRAERDRLQAKLTGLEKEIDRSGAEIARDRINMGQQRARLTTEQQEYTVLEAGLAVRENTARVEMERFKAPEAFLDRLKQHKTGLDERLTYLQKILSRIEERAVEARDRTEPEIAGITARLARREEVGRLAGTAAELETLWLAKRDEAGRLSLHISTLEENRRQAAGGKCPFLDSPCQNVGGDLEAHFALEINKAQAALAPLQQVIAETEAGLREARQAQQELAALEEEGRRLGKLKADVAGLTDRIRQTVAGLPDEKTGQVIAGILAEFKAAATGSSAVPEVLSVLAEELKEDLEAALAGLKSLPPYVDGWDKGDVNASPSGRLAGLAGKFGDVLHRLMSAAENLREMAERLDRSLSEDKSAAAGRLAAVEAERRQAVKRLQEIGAEQRQLIKMEEELAAREKTVALQRSDRDRQLEQLSRFRDLDARMEEARRQQAGHEEAYNEYLRHQSEASKVEQLSSDLARTGDEINSRAVKAGELRRNLTELAGQFDAGRYAAVEGELAELIGRRGTYTATLQERQRTLAEKQNQLSQMEEWRTRAAAVGTEIHRGRASLELLEFVRNILNRAGEPVAAVYLQHLSREANVIYREVAKENVTLNWQPDYDIALVDNHNGRERTRGFAQLSGGEQMTAALAVRLALLKHLSGTNIAFFDEPTTNLDSERRSNLAQTIPEVTADFDQIFIISHDDTFDSMTDNIIQLRKDTGAGTAVVE